jgi:hypothetical protein
MVRGPGFALVHGSSRGQTTDGRGWTSRWLVIRAVQDGPEARRLNTRVSDEYLRPRSKVSRALKWKWVAERSPTNGNTSSAGVFTVRSCVCPSRKHSLLGRIFCIGTSDYNQQQNAAPVSSLPKTSGYTAWGFTSWLPDASKSV